MISIGEICSDLKLFNFLDKEGLAPVPLKKPPQHKFTDHGEHAKVQPQSQVLSTTYYKFLPT
jgi:hypothetical protein